MGSPAKAFIATLAVAATTFTPLSQAYSHDRGHRHHHGGHGGYYVEEGWYSRSYHGPKPRRHRGPVVIERKNSDDALLYGVLGLAAGAIIGGAIMSDPARQPAYRAPQPRRVAPPPTYYPPAPKPVYSAGAIEPWTDAWYRYCSRKYRSFNPTTGTFRGYDGYDHFCVAR